MILLPLRIEISPRPDLAPDGFRRLGQALADWCQAHGASIPPDELTSLLAGEPPPPLALRHLAAVEASRGLELTGEKRRQALAGLRNPGGELGPFAAEYRRLCAGRVVTIECRRSFDAGAALERLADGMPRPEDFASDGDAVQLLEGLRQALPSELIEVIREV